MKRVLQLYRSPGFFSVAVCGWTLILQHARRDWLLPAKRRLFAPLGWRAYLLPPGGHYGPSDLRVAYRAWRAMEMMREAYLQRRVW